MKSGMRSGHCRQQRLFSNLLPGAIGGTETYAEGLFATVSLRAAKTKGMAARIATLTMMSKLAQAAEKKWQCIHRCNLFPLVLSVVNVINEVQHVA